MTSQAQRTQFVHLNDYSLLSLLCVPSIISQKFLLQPRQLTPTAFLMSSIAKIHKRNLCDVLLRTSFDQRNLVLTGARARENLISTLKNERPMSPGCYNMP